MNAAHHTGGNSASRTAATQVLVGLFPAAEVPPKTWRDLFSARKRRPIFKTTYFGGFRRYLAELAPALRDVFRFRASRRSIRVSGFSLTFAVSFLVWFLGCLWLAGFIVHVEHVERVVARGLLDDEHETRSLNVDVRRARGVVGKLQLDHPHAFLVERECRCARACLVPRGRLKSRTLRRRERDR